MNFIPRKTMSFESTQKSVEHLLHATVVTECLFYACDITPNIGIQVTSKVGLEFLNLSTGKSTFK